MRTRFLAVAHGLRGLDLWLKVQTAVVKSGEVVFGFLDRYVWPLKQTDTVHQQTIRVAPTKPTSSPLPQDIMTYCTYSTVTTPFLPGPFPERSLWLRGTWPEPCDDLISLP